MREWIIGILLLLGGALIFLAGVGVIRLPDTFTRMHAATKPTVLGMGLIAAGVALYFDNLGVTTRAALVSAFFALTAPVAAHMIGRAAYFVGTPLWERTVNDDLRGQYDIRTHRLESGVSHPTRPGETEATDITPGSGS